MEQLGQWDPHMASQEPQGRLQWGPGPLNSPPLLTRSSRAPGCGAKSNSGVQIAEPFCQLLAQPSLPVPAGMLHGKAGASDLRCPKQPFTSSQTFTHTALVQRTAQEASALLGRGQRPHQAGGVLGHWCSSSCHQLPASPRSGCFPSQCLSFSTEKQGCCPWPNSKGCSRRMHHPSDTGSSLPQETPAAGGVSSSQQGGRGIFQLSMPQGTFGHHVHRGCRPEGQRAS